MDELQTILVQTKELGSDASPAAYVNRLIEEVSEMRVEHSRGNSEQMRKELGDVLLAANLLAASLGEDPNALLSEARTKVISRLAFMDGNVGRLAEAKSLYP